MWARSWPTRFGATKPRSLMLRFHTQTAGVQLTAQQPVNNVVRVAMQALAAVLGGTQSLHTNAYDEALALPSEAAARLALRTQQVIAHESGVTDTADPLGGSYFIERLTDEIEAEAQRLIGRIDEMGGAVAAIESGFQKTEIERWAYAIVPRVEAGRGDGRWREPLRRRRGGAGTIMQLDPAIADAQASRGSTSARPGTTRPSSPPSPISTTPPGPATISCPPCGRPCAKWRPSARSATRCGPTSASTGPRTPSRSRTTPRSDRRSRWAARPVTSSVVLRRLIPIQPGSTGACSVPHPGRSRACPTRSSSSCTWPPSSASCWRRSASAPPGPAAST